MTFSIREYPGELLVKGNLNLENSKILRRHVTRIGTPMTKLVLNLNQVFKIEARVSYDLLKIFVMAIHENRSISIECKENKEVCQVMNETETFEIFDQAGVLI